MVKPLRTVIVEDEAVLLMHLEMMMEEAGHEVIGTAMGASEAIDLIKRTSPELVLLDIRLNDRSSGLDVARAIKDQKNLTIVFVTANGRMLSDEMEGAAAVISKPFNRRALQGSIAYLEECVHRPPPLLGLPTGLRLATAYSARMDSLRAAMN